MKILTFAAGLAFTALAWAGGPTTPAPTKAPAKKPSTTATATKPAVKAPAAKTAIAAKKPAASTVKTASAAHRTTKAPVAPRSNWRNRQASPTSDRYKEIQEALVARGYLNEEDATGAWGTASADAMKRFQAEQTLDSNGKIDSLSLIALGLGPKHDGTVPRVVVDGNNTPQLESGRN